jgi:hypothetical protein
VRNFLVFAVKFLHYLAERSGMKTNQGIQKAVRFSQNEPNLSFGRSLLVSGSLVLMMLITGCAQPEATKATTTTTPSTTTPDTVTPAPTYLYVATGACYSGTGNTTFTTLTSSNLLYRINTSTGQKDITVADYNAFPASTGDSPVGVASVDSDNLLVLVENATSGRRIESLPKSSLPSRSIFSGNITVMSAVLRGLLRLSDGSLLISKSSGIEKLTPSGVRIGAPLIPNNLGATCGATITLMTSFSILNNSKIVFTHAAATHNRFGIISASGYSGAGDCLGAQAAPAATAYPVASVYVAASNQLIVAYAGNAVTTNLNSIYVYDINETTNAITNPTVLYDASLYPATYNHLMYGISAMAYDADTKSLYVSTAISNATTVVNYAIEKFTYDPTAKTITRATTSTPFYNYGIDTKCIASMTVAN